MNLRPGSPTGNAPAPPGGYEDEDVDESIGGNMALGSRSAKSRSRMSRSGRRGSTKSRRSFGGSAVGQSRHGGAGGSIPEADEDDMEDVEAGFNGRNAIPDDFAE